VLEVTKFSTTAALAALVLVSLVGLAALAQAPMGGNVYRPQTPVAQPQAPVAQPQQPAPSYVAVPIAVLDVGRVFQEDARLKARQDTLNDEVGQMREYLNRKRDDILKRRAALKDLRAGSPEYEQIDAEVTKGQADLEVEARLKDKQLGQKMAAILHDAYREVEQEVAAIAASRGFIMVMRFNGQAITPERPESVNYLLTKDLVWYDPRLDITQEVIERMKARAQYNGPTMNNAARPGIPMQPTRTR
jgi:Skp family chaperone for outer membrane proteins